MADTKLDVKRNTLNRDLERLEDELATLPPDEREPLVAEIERIEHELRELTIDQHNQLSMEGGSEA